MPKDPSIIHTAATTIPIPAFTTPGEHVLGVVLGNGNNCRRSYDNIQNWAPDAAVGAGAAGPLTTQIVNFSQFGRCIDVTNQDVTSTFLIVWPCKQAPNVASRTRLHRGDVEQGLREADVVVEREYRTNWVHQGYLVRLLEYSAFPIRPISNAETSPELRELLA